LQSKSWRGEIWFERVNFGSNRIEAGVFWPALSPCHTHSLMKLTGG